MTRKEQMTAIENQLKEGVTAFFTSARYAELLKVMSRFHNYSFNNSLLIAMQCPGATYVAGYANWKNHLGRIVRRNESSIKILAPISYRKVNEETGEVEKELLLFKTTSVFDISQTDAIPNVEQVELGLKDLTGDVADYDKLIAAIIRTVGIPVTYENIKNGARGYYVPSEGRIVLCSGMSQLQTVKTLIHEGAHARLHNPSEMEKRHPDRDTKEVEAESTAFIVANMLGLDTSEYSFEYIAGWEGKDDLKKLNSSMTIIRNTANDLADAIMANLQAFA